MRIVLQDNRSGGNFRSLQLMGIFVSNVKLDILQSYILNWMVRWLPWANMQHLQQRLTNIVTRFATLKSYNKKNWPVAILDWFDTKSRTGASVFLTLCWDTCFNTAPFYSYSRASLCYSRRPAMLKLLRHIHWRLVPSPWCITAPAVTFDVSTVPERVLPGAYERGLWPWRGSF